MDPNRLLPILLGTAWLLPLASFVLIVFFGPRMGRHGRGAAFVATGAIGAACVLSLTAICVWLVNFPLGAAGHEEHAAAVPAIAGPWYSVGQFGSFSTEIGYYIDGLTVAMFAMVTFIATCIHVYSYGYMHEELHDVTDHLVTCSDGHHLKRRGRFHRFFQYLSLFCFSMLGLVIAGNLLMVFVFWELVGVCSYFLIGFYIERRSASNAANKAFIVNRVGDFGMIIGLMAVATGFGTFAFDGVFKQARPAESHHELVVPDGFVRNAAASQVEAIVLQSPGRAAAEKAIQAKLPDWRSQGHGYWLLVLAGLGVFCGCVGKSAQFPLHVWLPDAMEGPTPVSALIHAATMVAAGVYLVGRFYPVFTPEVLLVIAYVGCATLFIAATIAITATDIKRVLAYSTVSQLGYMMLALGVGGWIAGLFHLFTHAFFKALLFLCSGSVIHATHTNEMPEMGGLWRKMPWTAGTMLVGCLAIAGAGIPLVLGLSGYYSKDAILAQLLSFQKNNPANGWLFYVAAGGAAITTFYMFRLWFLTFAGKPRDQHVYDHAHESPWSMVGPLVALAALAIAGGWTVPGTELGLPGLLAQAQPAGIESGSAPGQILPSVVMPAEHESHAMHVPASLVAFGVAGFGFLIAAAFYWLRKFDPADVANQFPRLYRFLRDKWRFDELYRMIFIKPALAIAHAVASFDRTGIDATAHGFVRATRLFSAIDDLIDRWLVDGLVNGIARVIFSSGIWLRNVQTGNLRQYVVFLAVGTVALFVLISLFWNLAFAG